MSVFVALLRVELHLPYSGSLKAKRAELNRIKAFLHDRLGATVSEVAHQDNRQRATLAVALTAQTETRANELADGLERFLDGHFPQGVRVDRRILSWADAEAIG